MMTKDWFEFTTWLTGHDKDTINQMLEDFLEARQFRRRTAITGTPSEGHKTESERELFCP
jgi:hypothetical protein